MGLSPKSSSVKFLNLLRNQYPGPDTKLCDFPWSWHFIFPLVFTQTYNNPGSYERHSAI